MNFSTKSIFLPMLIIFLLWLTPVLVLAQTATFTNTGTNTATNTASATVTITVTNTPIDTGTNTATNTATNTPTNTACATINNTATNTATQTPTNTVTNTSTGTATNTATSTPLVTNTFTNTPTMTPTKTLTNTATITPSLIDTSTPTITPTFTSIPGGCGGVPIAGYSYPNPATGDAMNVSCDLCEFSTVTIAIYNVAAEKIASYDFSGANGTNIYSLNITGFSHGVYFFIIQSSGPSGNRKSNIEKFAIVR